MGVSLAAVAEDGDLAGEELDVSFAMDRGHEVSLLRQVRTC